MKLKKIGMCLLIISIIFNFMIVTKSMAAEAKKSNPISIKDISDKANGFITEGSGSQKISEKEALENFKPVGKVLVLVASIALVIATIVMGIKWIIGNPEQKGKLKEQMIGLVIAIVVVYGAVGIWAFARAVMKGL